MGCSGPRVNCPPECHLDLSTLGIIDNGKMLLQAAEEYRDAECGVKSSECASRAALLGLQLRQPTTPWLTLLRCPEQCASLVAKCPDFRCNAPLSLLVARPTL